MVEKSDCTKSGCNTAPKSNTLIIDTESDPGSWKQALQYSQHIKVIGEENR